MRIDKFLYPVFKIFILISLISSLSSCQRQIASPPQNYLGSYWMKELRNSLGDVRHYKESKFGLGFRVFKERVGSIGGHEKILSVSIKINGACTIITKSLEFYFNAKESVYKVVSRDNAGNVIKGVLRPVK